MKIESMRTRSYRSFKVDDADLPAEARERLSAICRYDELRAAGCAAPAASREIGVSCRTMYRWKAALAASGQRGLAPKSIRPRRVRRRSCKPSEGRPRSAPQAPFVDKAQIQRMLERKGLRPSVSTVGRILPRHRLQRPAASSATSSPSCASSPRRSTAAASSWPSSRTNAGDAASTSPCCRPEDPSETAASNAPTTLPAPSSGASTSATSPSTPPTPNTGTTFSTTTTAHRGIGMMTPNEFDNSPSCPEMSEM